MFKKKYECLWCGCEIAVDLIERLTGNFISHEICADCVERIKEEAFLYSINK